MDKKSPLICVFCGSSFGVDPAYAEAAKAFGRGIAARGFSLVFGGGTPGLMGAVSRSVHESGGCVTGVLPEFLRWVERPAEWEQNLIITPDLQLRKTRMLAMADAFVVLPGGAGTMDEFFEVITSTQLKVLNKPIILLNTKGFFAPLEALLRHLVQQGFAKPFMLELYRCADTPEAAVDMVAERLGLLASG
ncbi:MAG: TIGR00730 family Rossman fold protein [Alphaproteobacteria bacterium]|nr:TIGR00730 family Rossman fold protein [Alphaproteobacteria bacterium]